MEIATLIIDIFSLISTIAVAFAIFFLEVKSERKSDKKTQQIENAVRKKFLENQARIFLLDNVNEIEYLTLAQVATVKQSKRKIYSDGSGKYIHKRKFYSLFHKCEIDMQKEIIRQARFIDYEFEKYDIDEVIDCMLNLFLKDAKELGILSMDFLYDGAKYFHRGINYYGNKEIILENKLGFVIWRHLMDFINYKNAENKREMFNNLKNDFFPFFENPVYSNVKTFEEFVKLNKIPPLDYYWYTIAQSADQEDTCTFVVMEMVRQGAMLINLKKYENRDTLYEYPNPSIETYEDLYYVTVITLYCIYYDQVKSLKNYPKITEETKKKSAI